LADPWSRALITARARGLDLGNDTFGHLSSRSDDLVLLELQREKVWKARSFQAVVKALGKGGFPAAVARAINKDAQAAIRSLMGKNVAKDESDVDNLLRIYYALKEAGLPLD